MKLTIICALFCTFDVVEHSLLQYTEHAKASIDSHTMFPHSTMYHHNIINTQEAAARFQSVTGDVDAVLLAQYRASALSGKFVHTDVMFH